MACGCSRTRCSPTCSACADCPLAERCTTSKSGRTVYVGPATKTRCRSPPAKQTPHGKLTTPPPRPRVERKIAYLMRHRHGGRRARVCGQRKGGRLRSARPRRRSRSDETYNGCVWPSKRDSCHHRPGGRPAPPLSCATSRSRTVLYSRHLRESLRRSTPCPLAHGTATALAWDLLSPSRLRAPSGSCWTG